MKNLQTTAEQLPHNSALNSGLVIGAVSKVNNDSYHVTTAMGAIHAIKAASCLLTPQKGDEVIIAELEFSSAVIIAIVKQANDKQQSYQLSPEVHLTTHEGKLAVVSKQFNCIASEAANIYSQNLTINAETATASYSNYNFNSQFCTQTIGQHESTIASMTQTVDSYNFTAKHAFEKISELHHQVLGQLHMLIDKNYRVDCESADFFAENDIKMDADQIHMG